MSTFIYFVQAGDAGPIKIGKADNVEARITTHQCSHYERLTLLVAAPGKPADERALHRLLCRSRARGEWFRPGPELLQAVQFLRDGRDLSYVLRHLEMTAEILRGVRDLHGLAGTKRTYRRLRRDETKSAEFHKVCSEIIVRADRRALEADWKAREVLRRCYVKRRIVAKAEGALA